MAFRWKLPEFNAGFVDPEGVRNTMLRKADIDRSASEMSGYSSNRPEDIRQNPILAQSASMAMRGYQPNAAMGNIGERSQNAMMDDYRIQVGQERRQMAEQEMQRQELQGRYQQLQNELAQVDAQIAEVKKKYPGITNEREWRIAAKRAEIGDMSAYDNMMARGRDASQGVSGIENSLYNVLKLGWGLKTGNDEDAEITLANMNTELRKAEEWSRKTGQPLPPVYNEVKQAVEKYEMEKAQRDSEGKQVPPAGETDEEVRNAEETINKYTALIAKGKYTKADSDRLFKWYKEHKGSRYAKQIYDFWKENRFKTVEARNEYAALTKKMNDLFGKMRKNRMSTLDQSAEYNKLSNTEKQAWDRLYKWDDNTGYSKR